MCFFYFAMNPGHGVFVLNDNGVGGTTSGGVSNEVPCSWRNQIDLSIVGVGLFQLSPRGQPTKRWHRISCDTPGMKVCGLNRGWGESYEWVAQNGADREAEGSMQQSVLVCNNQPKARHDVIISHTFTLIQGKQSNFESLGKGWLSESVAKLWKCRQTN